MPWLPEEVNEVMKQAWMAGERSPMKIATAALRDVYTYGPDGQAMRWPSVRADCPEKKALEMRVVLRAEFFVAQGLDMEADQVWSEGGGY
jgi:hypothetical protein